jgi:hypothetical protein
MLPALSHHQATYHCYLVSMAAAEALGQAHPCRPGALLGRKGERRADEAAQEDEEAPGRLPVQGQGAACSLPGGAPSGMPQQGQGPPMPAWVAVRQLLYEAGADREPRTLLQQLLAAPHSARPGDEVQGRGGPADVAAFWPGAAAHNRGLGAGRAVVGAVTAAVSVAAAAASGSDA